MVLRGSWSPANVKYTFPGAAGIGPDTVMSGEFHLGCCCLVEKNASSRSRRAFQNHRGSRAIAPHRAEAQPIGEEDLARLAVAEVNDAVGELSAGAEPYLIKELIPFV